MINVWLAPSVIMIDRGPKKVVKFTGICPEIYFEAGAVFMGMID
jgi:hypothetical protein